MTAPAARVRSRSVVELERAVALGAVLVARTLLELGVELPLLPAPTPPEAVGLTLASERALAVLESWTEGRPTYRLAFAHGGHRRAAVFEIAGLVRARTQRILNDSRQPTWEVRIDERARRLLLLPKFVDARFDYRRADVPAASHPTIAAALARSAGVRADDVVWDPFCGSGLELIERGLLGPYRRLVGSDHSDRAIVAATENFRASGLQGYQLVRAAGGDYSPSNVTLILTNPPMGRRVARGHAPELLLEFLRHARRVLVPHGRLVWLSPLGRADVRRVNALGWSVQRGEQVDLGGFSAELQTLTPA